MGSDISIIIPSCNRLWSLPRAVESCRSAGRSVQIIVIDDASNDGTRDWLATQRDVIAFDGHGWGKPAGINAAARLATGKYIRFLDSDDWLNPCANEQQFDHAEREGADVILAGMDIYEEDQHIERLEWVPTDDFIAQQLGEVSGSHYSAFLFRRTFVEDIPHRTFFPASDFASRDDRCFMLEVALRKPVLAVCPTPTLCHRHHARGRLQFHGGLKRDGTNIQQLYIYRQVLNILERTGELTERRKRAAAKILWPLAHWIGYTHPREAAEVADWILQLDPSFQPPETGWLGTLYRRLGFRKTETILRLRRSLIHHR